MGMVALIVNPVNSVVPAMATLWEKKGLNPMNVVGVTTLDCVRAEKFVHEITGKPLEEIIIPVIGGHAGTTILPLFSQNQHSRTIAADKIPGLDEKAQNAGTVVVGAKNGKGSATLSMGYAGARFGRSILSGLSGTPTVACAYVKSSITSCPYFATKVTFGRNGVETVHPTGELSDYEKGRLAALLPVLQEEVDCGLEYSRENSFP